jgi:hypothetical protein
MALSPELEALLYCSVKVTLSVGMALSQDYMYCLMCVHDMMMFSLTLSQSHSQKLHRHHAAEPEDAGSPTSPLLTEWSAHVKRLRSSLTIRDVFGLMLCAVPGTNAWCLNAAYGTVIVAPLCRPLSSIQVNASLASLLIFFFH